MVLQLMFISKLCFGALSTCSQNKMPLLVGIYIIHYVQRKHFGKTKAMAGTKLLVLCVVVSCLKLQQGQAHGKLVVLFYCDTSLVLGYRFKSLV